MRLSKQYKLAEGASKDDSRPTIQHALVCHFSAVPDLVRIADERMADYRGQWEFVLDWIGYEKDDYDDPTRGIACVTDGWLLAIVPVTMDEEDIPGLVRADVFQAKYQRRSAKEAYFDLRKTKVTSEYYNMEVIRVGDQMSSQWLLRTNGLLLPDDKFPNIIPVVKNAIEAEGTTEAVYDLRLVDRVRKVTGIEYGHFKLHDTEASLIVGSGKMNLPLAIVMPMHRSKKKFE